ncbi:MAG: hypothetical protein ACO3F2_03570 [Roseiflexaceae bacterium]|jgi:hypothetical protein
MCGAVRFHWHDVNDSLLNALPQTDVGYESQYWGVHPILPVHVEGHTLLVEWGNRSAHRGMPATGWAQRESVKAGKWNHHQPVPVVIPVQQGYEQGVWFSITHGIHGILLGRGADARVFMMTEAATPMYLALTNHPRQPWLINQSTIEPLPGSQSQMRLW